MTYEAFAAQLSVLVTNAELAGLLPEAIAAAETKIKAELDAMKCQ